MAFSCSLENLLDCAWGEWKPHRIDDSSVPAVLLTCHSAAPLPQTVTLALGAQDRSVSISWYQRVADLRVSTTDPDASLMLTKNGSHLGYQTHYVVDGGKSRIILRVLVAPSEVSENKPRRHVIEARPVMSHFLNSGVIICDNVFDRRGVKQRESGE